MEPKTTSFIIPFGVCVQNARRVVDAAWRDPVNSHTQQETAICTVVSHVWIVYVSLLPRYYFIVTVNYVMVTKKKIKQYLFFSAWCVDVYNKK